MRLYEEYLKRHNIHDVPIIHHAHNSCIVFKTKDFKLWQDLLSIDIVNNIEFSLPFAGMLNIKWIHNDSHPGHYEITLNYNIHDGYLKDQIFSTRTISNLRWQEYESFIESCILKFKNEKLMKNRDDAFVLCWEMFVSSYDGWFSKQGGDIKYLLFQTLDEDLCSSTRLDFIAEILKKISYAYPGVFRNWKYEVLNKVQHFSQWFVDLVDKDHSKYDEIDKNVKELLSSQD